MCSTSSGGDVRPAGSDAANVRSVSAVRLGDGRLAVAFAGSCPDSGAPDGGVAPHVEP